MARTRSTTGLHLLDAQTRVALTGTPYHQDSLVWYLPADDGPPSQVVVELVPALLWSGDQAGWWGIEVRLDGYRVGELTHPEAGWYWPTVDGMLRSGRRPGAEAHVVLGETGLLEVELYLPVAGAPAAEAPYPAAATDAARGRPAPPLWMGVAAAALAVVMVASVAADRINRFEPVTASPAADTVLSLAAELPSSPPPVDPAPAPAPAPAVTSSAAPVPVAAVQPQPRALRRVVTAPKPKPKPKPKLPSKAAPKPRPSAVLRPVVVPEPTKPPKTSTPKPKPEKPKPEKPEKPKPEKPKPEKPKPEKPEKPDPKPDKPEPTPEKPGSDEPSGSTPDDGGSSSGED